MTAKKSTKGRRKSGEVVGFPGVPEWLSQAELERVTGLSRQTLAELAREPDCPREQRDGWKYPWPAWNTWYVNRRVDRAVERVKPADFEEARARKTAAEAELAELELAKQRGDLITVADAGKVMDDRLDRVAARLKAVPSKDAYRFVGLTGIPEVVPVLRQVIDGVMAELSE